MTDRELKQYIEGTACHTGQRKNCEECIDSHLCRQYVKKGLKNKSYSELEQNEQSQAANEEKTAGTELTPGKPLECTGNGITGQECCCDECNYLQECINSNQWEKLKDLTELLDKAGKQS